VRLLAWFRGRSSLASALAVVAVFVAFSLVWIPVTDRALGWLVPDRELMVRVATYKGLVFILVAAGLIFWLAYTALELKGAETAQARAGAPQGRRPRFWVPVALIVGSALLLEGVAYVAYRFQESFLAKDSHQRMLYLARRKADRIDAWVQERIGDAAVLARDPLLREQLARWRTGGADPALRRQLQDRLATVQTTYGYPATFLLGAGDTLIAASGGIELEPWERSRVVGFGRDRRQPEVVWQPGDETGSGPLLQMACLARIHDPSAGQVLGTLVFRLDPQVFLAPANTIGGWPTHSPSGATYLLAREGRVGMILNQARGPSGKLIRRDLDQRQYVGVQALLEGSGMHTGVDFRQVPTVAASWPLRSLPWVLMVKLDRDEYLQPVRKLVWLYLSLALLFLVVAAAFISAWYRRERAEFNRLEADSRSLDGQIRLLSEFSNEIVLVLDEQGVILEANDVAVTAYQRGLEELRGLPVLTLRDPACQGEYPSQFGQVKKEGSLRFQTWHRRKDGSTFPVEVSTHAFQLRGKPLVRSLIRDLTAQREYEARIRTLNEELEQRVRDRTAELEAALREVESFSYSVSHDLRAPLRGLDGFSLALLEDYGDRLDERGRHYLERIRNGAQRMGQLMDDLLDLARLSRHQLKPDRVDLSAMVRQILAELAEQDGAGRRVETRVQDGLTVRADARLMHIALVQLLANAWKFTRDRPDARIAFTGGPDAGGGITCQVRDNGVGFDMAYAEKLFGAFQRLHDPARFPGSGVGLAIAYRVLLRHGGRIWAQAEPDRGAVFSFNLPA
jgi:PAS domain S-box-containing protein